MAKKKRELKHNGEGFYPTTIVGAVADERFKVPLASMFSEYNLSALCPTFGYKSDGTLGGDLYDLARAIEVLIAQVGALPIGSVAGFKDYNYNASYARYEYLGGDLTTVTNWRKVDNTMLLVTITQTSGTNIAYTFTKANFDAVQAVAEGGKAVSVKITDNRNATYKTISLSAIYQTRYNTALQQIEVFDPAVARGFYLLDGAVASRGCVTSDTAKYIERGTVANNSTGALVSTLRFNATTGYYEYYDLKDLSEQDLSRAYSFSSTLIAGQDLSDLFNRARLRFNFPIQRSHDGVGSCSMARLAYFSRLDALSFDPTQAQTIRTNNVTWMLIGSHVKYIYGAISLYTSANQTIAGSFLEEIRLRDVRDNLTFSSGVLSLESVLYMIRMASTSSTIVFTYHQDVYARAVTDDAIIEALAASANITIASS